MKFPITWKVHEGKLHDTLALFAAMPAGQEASLMGDDVKLAGRWHDLVLRGKGAASYEATSAEDLAAYALNWNRFTSMDIAPVLDDEGARAVGQGMSG